MSIKVVDMAPTNAETTFDDAKNRTTSRNKRMDSLVVVGAATYDKRKRRQWCIAVVVAITKFTY